MSRSVPFAWVDQPSAHPDEPALHVNTMGALLTLRLVRCGPTREERHWIWYITPDEADEGALGWEATPGLA